MESKLDLILKELQDLKLRVEKLENKNTRETSRDDRRMENTNRHRDGEAYIIRRIKIDPPTFNSILDLKLFSGWISDQRIGRVGYDSAESYPTRRPPV